MPEPTLGNFNLFFQLSKIDPAKREVWGRFVQEVPDKAREILDYDSSKPLFEKWAADTKARTAVLGKGGESLGAVREMHQPSAVGKIIDMQFNDAEKAIDIGTVCVDDAAWNKVVKGVYTGFSVGGGYAKRWLDPQTRMTRYTADPAEASYVDNPAIPTAAFTLIKADGSTELRKLGAPLIDPLTPADLNPAPDNPGPLVGTNPIEDSVPDTLPQVPSGEETHPMTAIGGGIISPDQIDEARGVERVNPAKPPAPDNSALNGDAVGVLKALIREAVEEAMQKAAADEKTQQETHLKAVGSNVGIARRDGEPLTPPKDYPSSPDDYGDPANHAHPLDSKARAQSAMAYFNAGGMNKAMYADTEWSVLGRRIASAASKWFGAGYQYDPQEQKVSPRKEAQKMAEFVLKKDANVGALMQQLASALDVGVDQVAQDPEGALMAMIGAIRQQMKVSTPDLSTPNPVPPMGSQERVTDAVIANAAPAGGDTMMEKVMAQMATLTETVNKLVTAQSAAPVAFNSGFPMGDLAALVPSIDPDEVERDPVLKTIRDGGPDALLKAARLAGTDDHPDFATVFEKARQQAAKEGLAQFTNLMMAKGFATGFVPTAPTAQ